LCFGVIALFINWFKIIIVHLVHEKININWDKPRQWVTKCSRLLLKSYELSKCVRFHSVGMIKAICFENVNKHKLRTVTLNNASDYRAKGLGLGLGVR